MVARLLFCSGKCHEYQINYLVIGFQFQLDLHEYHEKT